jgi:hypothetical protein
MALVITEILEERIASIMRVTRMDKLGTMLAKQLKHAVKKYYVRKNVWYFFAACFSC